MFQSAFKWKFADMAVSSQLSSEFADMAVPSQLSSGKILLIWLCPVSFQVEILLYGCTQSAFKWRIIAVQIIIPKQQSPTAAQHISTAMETVKQTLKRLLTYFAEFRLLCENWFCQLIYKKFDFSLIIDQDMPNIFRTLKDFVQSNSKKGIFVYLIILFLKFIVLAYQIFHFLWNLFSNSFQIIFPKFKDHFQSIV